MSSERKNIKVLFIAGSSRSGSTWFARMLNELDRNLPDHPPLLRCAADDQGSTIWFGSHSLVAVHPGFPKTPAHLPTPTSLPASARMDNPHGKDS